MKQKSYRKKKVLYSSILLAIFSINMIAMPSVLNIYGPNNGDDIKNDISLHSSGTYKNYTTNVPWISNSGFDSVIDPWTTITDNSNSDLDVGYTSDEAEILVYGDVRTESVILDASTYSTWNSFQKSALSIDPNEGYGEDADGVYCGHIMSEYDSPPRGSVANTPIMHWKTDVNLDVDMSDYEITSVSLQAVMNASVSPDIDTPGDTRGRWIPSDYRDIDQYYIYDYAQFFVEVADTAVSEENTYRIAFNQTRYLGNEATSNYDIGGDIETKNPTAIKNSLTNVFAVDSGHDDFSLVLGIYMYCEDNIGEVDVDTWDDMRISFVNLTFTYEKLINEDSEVSWNQEGSAIPSGSVVTEAEFSLKCMLNQTWVASPTSELIIYFNGDDHSETIKLRDVSSMSLQEVSFDVTSRIITGTNINVSIQLYIWEEFTLNQTIKILIDDVYLNISYYKEFNEIDTKLDLLIDHANETLDKSAEAVMGDFINITAIYKNSSNDKITGATVRITGEGMNQTLSPDGDQYYISLQTSILGYGDSYFTIEAMKNTYETQEIQFKISVVDRYAIIDKVYLNGTDKTSTTTIEDIPSGYPLNITIDYLDNLTRNPIESANITLKDKNIIIGNFSEHQTSHNYSCSYNTTGLTQGVYYYTIVAEKKNCTTDYVQITVIIDAKGTNYQLFLNGSVRNEITSEINSIVNINLSFTDSFSSFIINANVEINGSGINELMTPNGENYTVTIDTTDLDEGNNRLDIYASKSGYISQSITLWIHIIETDSIFEVYLNGNNETASTAASIDVTIGVQINITIKFLDVNTGLHVPDVVVNLTGYGKDNTYIDLVLDQDSTFSNITLDSTQTLGRGINWLSVYASRPNYQVKSKVLKINVNPILIDVFPPSGSDIVRVETGQDIIMKLFLNDTYNNQPLIGATVNFRSALGAGTLVDLDNDGIYEFNLGVAPKGTYKVYIDVFVGESEIYEYVTYELLISVEYSSQDALLLAIIQILATCGIIGGIGFTSYIYAYQTYLKYPKFVRKIRHLRKKVKKEKNLKEPITLITRNQYMNNRLRERLMSLRIDPAVERAGTVALKQPGSKYK